MRSAVKKLVAIAVLSSLQGCQLAPAKWTKSPDETPYKACANPKCTGCTDEVRRTQGVLDQYRANKAELEAEAQRQQSEEKPEKQPDAPEVLDGGEAPTRQQFIQEVMKRQKVEKNMDFDEAVADLARRNLITKQEARQLLDMKDAEASKAREVAAAAAMVVAPAVASQQVERSGPSQQPASDQTAQPEKIVPEDQKALNEAQRQSPSRWAAASKTKLYAWLGLSAFSGGLLGAFYAYVKWYWMPRIEQAQEAASWETAQHSTVEALGAINAGFIFNGGDQQTIAQCRYDGDRDQAIANLDRALSAAARDIPQFDQCLQGPWGSDYSQRGISAITISSYTKADVKSIRSGLEICVLNLAAQTYYLRFTPILLVYAGVSITGTAFFLGDIFWRQNPEKEPLVAQSEKGSPERSLEREQRFEEVILALGRLERDPEPEFWDDLSAEAKAALAGVQNPSEDEWEKVRNQVVAELRRAQKEEVDADDLLLSRLETDHFNALLRQIDLLVEDSEGENELEE